MTEIDLDGWSGSTGNRWWVHHSLVAGVDTDLVVPTRYRAHPSQIAGDANADRWQIILLGFTYTWQDGNNGWRLAARNGGVNRTIFEMPPMTFAVADTVNCFIPLSPAAAVSPIENPASIRLVVDAGSAIGSITLWGLHENAYGKRAWTGSPIDYNA